MEKEKKEKKKREHYRHEAWSQLKFPNSYLTDLQRERNDDPWSAITAPDQVLPLLRPQTTLAQTPLPTHLRPLLSVIFRYPAAMEDSSSVLAC